MVIKHHKLLEISYLRSFCDDLRQQRDPQIIRGKLDFLLEFYSVINFHLKPSPDKLLFRSRKSDSSGYRNISELGSPPPELTKAGRLNESKRPVLYLSQNILSTFDEIRVTEGDYVQVAAYRHKDFLGPHIAIIGDIKEVFRWGKSKHHVNISEYVTRTLIDMTKDDGMAYLSYIYTDSFLSDLLTNKLASKNEYIHTRKIGDLICKKHPHIDGVCYPGIESDGAWNLALKCSSADKLFEIDSVWLFKVNSSYGYGLYDKTLIRSAQQIDPSGNIHWDNEEL